MRRYTDIECEPIYNEKFTRMISRKGIGAGTA